MISSGEKQKKGREKSKRPKTKKKKRKITTRKREGVSLSKEIDPPVMQQDPTGRPVGQTPSEPDWRISRKRSPFCGAGAGSV